MGFKKKTVIDTMPKSFQELYPTTRVIVDCTENFYRDAFLLPKSVSHIL